MSRDETERQRRQEWMQRVDDLFVRTLDLAPPERAELLSRQDDPELRREVEQLLAAAEEEDSLLRSGRAAAGALFEDLSHSLVPYQAGDRIGRYRLVRQIGRGGMGVVYLAERADGAYEQQVALKVMRLGAGAEALARFTRERQILARLEHPNIARLLDGGVSDTGHPYLVVEYVDGEQILAYCDRRGLSTAQRLELLGAVCEAVESAHRQLVVHRDIKPSNILVAADGQVKLLDFGIAKLLEDDGEEGLLTRPGSSAMTPRYASPEQIEGRPVTVASDIYQLGILGYELLTGRRPYELEGTTPSEAWQRVRRVSPPPASRLAAESDDRRVRARARSLARDLDAVLLKALRKSSERRYGSVYRLREDIERWLSGRPVLARPDSLGYRLRKFVGRHKAAVAVAGAAAIGLIALSAGFTWRLARERDQTLLEADRARHALARAEQLRAEGEEVLDFLEGLFEVSDPMQSRGEQLTARDLLDRGAEKIRIDLTEQPLVRARMMHTLGGLYAKLGLYRRAEELLRGARELQEVDRQSRAYAETTASLGFLYYDSGEWGRAAELLQESLALLEATEPSDELALAATLYRLAIVRGDSGEPDLADGLYRRALAIYERIKGPRSPEVASLLNSLAINANSRGRSQDAEALYLRSLDIFEELYGHDDPRLGHVLNNLGLVSANLGRPQRSVEFLERSLRVRQAALGEDHPDLAAARMNLGIAYFYVDDLASSEEQLVAARRGLRRSLAPRHPTFVDLEIAFGRLRRLQGRLSESLAHLETAHRLAVEVLGEEHERTARALGLRGRTLVSLGRATEAKEVLTRALATYERLEHGYTHYDLLIALGEAHWQLGEPARAEELFRESLRALTGSAGPEDELRRSADLLAGLLRELGRDAEARQIEGRYGIERNADAGP